VLEGSDAIGRWRSLMGPTNSIVAKDTAPSSLRGRYGTDGTQNATHGSDSEASALREINYFYLAGQRGFSTEIVTPYVDEIEPVDFCEEHTFAMIKPGTAESCGDEIRAITLAHGFEIVSEIHLTLTSPHVRQFYAEHIGKTFFKRLSEYMSSGPVIGLQLKRIASIRGWRNLIGPTNLDKCKDERGDSIRALFAMDGTRNACHGSDSPESAQRELTFLFGIGGETVKVYPETAQRAVRYTPPPPVVKVEKPPSEAYLKRIPPVLNVREHKKMMGYIKSNVDPIVRGLVQRAIIKKPTNMIDFALTDLAEQKRLGVGVKLPPMSDGIPGSPIKAPPDQPLPRSYEEALSEVKELRASVAALALSVPVDGLDSASIASMSMDDDSVITEAAIAAGLNHYF